jgi:hypothetical protein
VDEVAGGVGEIDAELDRPLLLGRSRAGEGQGESSDTESEHLPAAASISDKT